MADHLLEEPNLEDLQQEDLQLLLELVLLSASVRGKRPTKSDRMMPQHCRDIFDRLLARQRRDSARARGSGGAWRPSVSSGEGASAASASGGAVAGSGVCPVGCPVGCWASGGEAAGTAGRRAVLRCCEKES